MTTTHGVVWEVWPGESLRRKAGWTGESNAGTRLFAADGVSARSRLGRFRFRDVDAKELDSTVSRLKRDWLNVKPWSVEILSGVGNREGASRPGAANVCEQSYLCGSDLGGVDALAAWQIEGGRGRGTKVVVFDFGAENHVELEGSIGGIDDETCPDSHGTSILGILRSRKRLLGLVDEADVEFRQIRGPSGCERGPLAATNLLQLLHSATCASDPGSVFVLAVWFQLRDTRGLPPEAWRCARILMKRAVAKGIHVIQAAGNIERDLGDFVPRCADSGSIVVGAGLPHVPVRRLMSNYGKRVDLHQWGDSVLTAGTGPSCYCYFSATSAATAIVAGVVASLATILRRSGSNDWWKRPKRLRKLLRRTGYWWSPGIGPRPDLAKVLELLARNGRVLTGNLKGNPAVRRCRSLVLVRRARRRPADLRQGLRVLRYRFLRRL